MATNTAASFTNHTGNASAGPFSISFSYLSEDEIDVTVGGVLKTKTTHYTFPSATTISFTSGNHPGNGVAIKFQRDTDVSAKKVDFQDGSVLTETDLDNNSDQILFGLQENLDVINNDILKRDGSQTVTGNLVFEGATDDGNETTLAITDPTGDRTLTVPDITGTIVTTGDTGTVTSAMINNGTIVAGDLASNSVTTAKITDANVTTAKVADDAITSAKIADNAITSAHIADGTVVAADIGANAVTASELADDAVDTAAIANSAVTNAKLGADAVNGSKIADDAVDSEHYVDGSIDTAHIADSQITTAKLASNAVTTAKITDANITTAKLADDAVNSAKILDTAITTEKIADNNITSSKILNSTITTAKIVDNAVTAAKIADGAITSAHIAADTVVAADIAANAVTASELADNAVDTAAIAADAVTGAKIADDAIGSEHIEVLDAALQFGDNVKAQFGASNDLEVFHDGSNSRVKDAGTGGLILQTGLFEVKNPDDNKFYIKGTEDGSVELRYANSKKLETTSAGVTVTGTLTADLADNSIDSEHYVDGSIDTAHIADAQITTAKVADDAINSAKILDTAITTAKIADNNITSSKILDSTITTAKIVDNAVTAAKVGTFNLADLTNVHTSSPNDGQVLKWINSNSRWEPANDAGAGGATLADADYGEITVSSSGAVFTIDNDVITGAKIADDAVGAEHIEVLDANLQFGDSVKAQFGTGTDFELYHDGTDNVILSKGASCDLLTYVANGELAIKAVANGGVELYHDNALQCKTASYGLDFADNKRADFGDGNDLLIYHDGSHSYIDDSGTGALKVRSSSFQVQNADGSEYIINTDADDGVDLYFNGSKKFETTSTGITVTGSDTTGSVVQGDFRLKKADATQHIVYDASNARMNFADSVSATFGDASDLKIYHDGTDNIILSSGASCDLLTYVANGELAVKAVANGAVELYYDNSKKLDLYASGVNVYGDIDLPSGSIFIRDSEKLICGTGDDLQIYHDGSNSYIHELGTGNLVIRTSNLYAWGHSGEDFFNAVADGAVSLYYDNSKKFETTAAGTAVNQTTAGIGLSLINTYNASAAINLSIKNAHSDASSGKHIQFLDNGGNEVGRIMCNNSSTTYHTSSDYRLKENEEAISDGITRLKTLKPYRFNFKVNPDKTVDGFFAHEVTAIPEAVEGEKDGTEMQSLDYSKFTPLLTAALQEAITKIETLETKVAALESA